MTKLYAEATITDTNLETAQYIEPNCGAEYYFIPGSVFIEIDVNDETFEAEMQTGHNYINGDYGSPSNKLYIYSGSPFLEDFMAHFSPYMSQEEVDILNEHSGTSYNFRELSDIKNALALVIAEADQYISDRQDEAEREAEEDEHTYVNYTEKEYNADTGKFEQCQPVDILRFDSDQAAETFIDNEYEKGNYAYKLDKASGRGEFTEQQRLRGK